LNLGVAKQLEALLFPPNKLNSALLGRGNPILSATLHSWPLHLKEVVKGPPSGRGTPSRILNLKIVEAKLGRVVGTQLLLR